MHEAHSTHAKPSVPLTQRELVGLALQPGARRMPCSPAAPQSQRDRVRLALALGIGGAPKAAHVARRGIYR